MTPPPLSIAPAPEGAAVSAAARTVEFAILEDYEKGDDLGDVDADFKLFADLGIHVWRGSFGWDDFEPERGRYDFDWLEQFVELAGRRGLTLRPYLGYTPEWAAVGRNHDAAVWNDPPSRIEDWTAFVRALVERLGPNIASYEIYNEENVSMWWDGDAAEYNEVLRAASAEIRMLAPRARIVLGGMVWPDADWLQAACGEQGNAHAFDVVAFHAYPETWTKPGVRVENYLGDAYREQFLPLVRSCGDKPVWINEAGFATAAEDGPDSERQQARWWLRAVATWVAEPTITEIGVYEIKDLAPEEAAIGDEPNYHLGLTRSDRSPKLAYYTIRLLVALVGNQPIEVLDDRLTVRAGNLDAAKIHAHAFRRADGKRVVLAWADEGVKDLELTLDDGTPASRATSYALDGTPSVYRALKGTTLRNVGVAPDDARIFVIE